MNVLTLPVSFFAITLQPTTCLTHSKPIPRLRQGKKWAWHNITNELKFSDVMKKLFLMAVVMLASVASYAQHAVGSVTLQPKVGLNIASLTKSDGADPRYGVAAGAEFEYQATDIFSVSAGALYSMQGNKYKSGKSTVTNKIDYINIPILANVYVVKGLAVKLGIQPGFKVNNEVKFAYGDKSHSEDVDNAKSFDFSIPVGLSYEYSNVVLDARYNFGCTKVADHVDARNSVFQITLGYKFDL